ncbi:MAG: hypothetical protein ACTSUE_03115 [Promethearchaeota archaeon]
MQFCGAVAYKPVLRGNVAARIEYLPLLPMVDLGDATWEILGYFFLASREGSNIARNVLDASQATKDRWDTAFPGN